MEEFSKAREEWLRKFLELPNGIPDGDTFRRVFERLEPEMLSECLHNWLSCNRSEGSIITADAMSCQKKIVERIREKHADYVIGLKENQPGLLSYISLYFSHFASELPVLVTHDKDHGRMERREYRLLSDLSWQEDSQQWKGLSSASQVTTTVTKGEQTSIETKYFISSLDDLKRIAYAIRSHWSIENQLHWCLDVIFDEDGSRARKDNSPLNLNVLRKVALVLCKAADMGRRVSIQKKRFRAALDPAAFRSILLG